MLIKNFDEVVKQIQEHLVDYLEEKGIDTKKKFSCLDPKHEDKNPSCSIIPGGIRAYCHSQGHIFDIFDAVRIIENKPGHGPGYVTDVLLYLANKYGIEVQMGEISEEKAAEISTYRAYRAAAEYIARSNHKPSPLVKKEIERRGWQQPVLTDLMVGWIPSHHAFIQHMISGGFDEKFLEECDLVREDLFNEDNIIFTTCDEFGHPVGFAARNMHYIKGDENNGPKYVNQRHTGIKANIFQKGKRLYGFNLARETEGAIYIFEGQGDVITARQAGIHNCCAVGSTAMTTDHVHLLKENNKFNIILCLDPDDAGQNKIEKLLDTRFAGHRDMRVSIVLIPNGQDPDDFIRDNGVEAFRDLAKWSAFEWRLDRFGDKTDPEEVVRAMIPFIVNEASYITQEEMANTLAKHTGYAVKTILAEVNRLQNVQEERKQSERMTIIDRALHEAKENPIDAEMILTDAKNRLFEINKKYDEDHMSEDACLKEIVNQRLTEEAKSDKFAGFELGCDLAFLQEALCGEWDKDVLMIFGGKANCGKCIAYDSLVYTTEDGYGDTIEEIALQNKTSHVLTASALDKTTIQTISAHYNDHIKPVAKVTTILGNYLESTASHKWLTLDGWKRQDQLTTDDFVAIPLVYPEHSEYNIDDDHIRLLAYYLAEGCLTCGLGISNTDKIIIDDFKAIITKYYNSDTLHFDEEHHENSIYPRWEKGTWRDESHPRKQLENWLTELGLFDKKAIEKTLPKIVFKFSNRQKLLFLSTFFDCDGWYSLSQENVISVGTGLGSEKLIRQLQLLLFTLGVPSKVRHKPTTNQSGKQFDSWCCEIRNRKYLQKLVDMGINPILKEANLNKILNYMDIAPREYRGMYNTKECGDFIYVKVDSIGPYIEKQVYDLTVEDTHNFTANGLIVHNTALFSKLAYSIAAIEANDAICIVLTIDDTREQFVPRLVSVAEGSKQITLNQIKSPNYWASKIPDLVQRRQVGYQRIESLVRAGRLVIKDQSHGTTLAYMETLIQYYREKYPTRRIVFFIDNFHLLTDYRDQKEERVRYKTLSHAIKGLATTYHVPILSTMEYTKLAPGTRPSNNNIAESVAMEYDANLICHLYNELHDLGPAATNFHVAVNHEGNGIKMPRIEIIFGKNKITSFKESLYFNFYPASSDFIGIDQEVIAAELQSKKDEIDTANRKNGRVNPNAGGLFKN